jgi:hypothetical protein
MMPAGDKKKALNEYALRLFTNENKGSSLLGRDLDNWYISMSKMCQGKCCQKQVLLTGSLQDGSASGNSKR